MISKLEQLDMNLSSSYFEVRNVVCRLEFEREFELSELSVAIGLEHCEYDPEQSPGLLCRLPDCEGVFLIFRTGVVLSTGAGSIGEVSDNINSLVHMLDEINIDLDNEVTGIEDRIGGLS
jgi:transcription initiation factor TFIID TATA-box-binding protein